MTRLFSDHRAPINLACERQGDFSCVQSSFDLIVGEELSRGMAPSERNLHFLPNRVESVTRDGVYHRDKRLASGQTGIRLVDKVQCAIMLKDRSLCGG